MALHLSSTTSRRLAAAPFHTMTGSSCDCNEEASALTTRRSFFDGDSKWTIGPAPYSFSFANCSRSL
ncbi:hypothetical protein M6B38_271645 [Iris pallida]|nr:hypothetical protein M6B38_271645 [Iris pallida]